MTTGQACMSLATKHKKAAQLGQNRPDVKVFNNLMPRPIERHGAGDRTYIIIRSRRRDPWRPAVFPPYPSFDWSQLATLRQRCS
jgi:hypothetical protein